MLTGLVVLLAAGSAPPDWTAISSAATIYSKAPSASAAASLLVLLPGRQLNATERAPEEVHDQLYSLLPVLAPRIAAGQDLDIRLCFQLIYISDGAFTEELLAVLGTVAGQHPDAYLNELLRARPGLAPLIDPIRSVTFTYPEQESKVSVSELRARERALRTVRTRELQPLRDECLRLLEQELRVAKADGA
jgi:hypothetical protein